MQSCFVSNGVCWYKVAVLFLIFCLMKRGSAISFEEFVGYPFDEANGYSIFPRGVDLKHGLPIPVLFPYFGRTFSYANIDDSGYISLLDVNTSASTLPLSTPYTPRDFPLNSSNISGIDWSAVVAPYWYDVDTRGNRSGMIYYKNVTRDTDPDVIGEIDSLAKPHVCGFATTWALIVTWDHVGYYNRNSDKLNTFQVIIATSGLRSIAVFNYAENGINRAGGAIAGYNVNIDGGNRHFKLPGSLSDDIQYIDSTTGNTRRQGQWVFSLNDFLTPPTQLTVLEISTTSFTVFWRPPLEYLQNGSALCYVSTVNWTYREGENVLVLQSKVNSTVLQWSVAELLPDYAHQVSMYAALRDWSGPSALVWIRTSPTAIPPPIDGFTASSPTSTSIAVLWKEPTATIDYYKLTIHSVETNTTEHSDLFRTVTSHTFHNLSSSTAYSVTITAVNKGKSGPPVSLNVTTQGTPVPSRIDGFTATSPTSTSIAVLWNPTVATIDYYKLTIHSVETNTTEHSDLFRTVTSHTFHNLSSSTAYSVTITAVNKGKSGPTVSLDVTTQGIPVPSRIDGFTATSPTSTSIAVLWNPSMATIDYYKLTIHSVETNTTEHSDLFRTVTSHTFHNLSSSTAYSVTITAINKGKSGPPVSLNVTTQGTPVPSRIDGFTASSPTSTSIAVLWNPSMATIDYYKLTIHSVEVNTTEHSDLFRTVTSHTFHNLSSSTAYSVTITAVNKGKSGPPVSLNVTTQGTPVPSRIDGFTASSPTSTSIAVLWNPTTATIDYYKLTIHSVEVNTTEHSDLFRTVTSHTFHNLSSSTAYSVTITAVNKGKSGPPVSLDVTTQGTPDSHTVSPLAFATGVLGAMVAIGIVAVPLLMGCTCRQMHKRKGKDQAAPAARAADDNFNFELQENVAYATTPYNKQTSEGCCEMEEEEQRSEENNTSVKGNTVLLEPTFPKLPIRQYLLEKERGPTEFASIPVFDEMDFKRNSGWYKPTVADVISKKLGVDAAVFADLGPGVYLMCHKTKEKAKWVGLSPDLCRTLCGLFFQLYLKQHCELNPLQVELKFFSPNAADWDIQVWFTDPKDLLLERAKKIVEFKTLKPLGLNNSLKFTTKEVWEEFTIWCAAQRRQHS